MAERFIGNCVFVKSKVLDGDRSVDKVRTGSTYGHDLTAMNEGVWTLDVYAHSISDDPEQVAYVRTGQPKEWILAVTLSPAEETSALEIINCIKRKSGKSKIKTKVLLSNNLSDNLAVDLKVE